MGSWRTPPPTPSHKTYKSVLKMSFLLLAAPGDLNPTERSFLFIATPGHPDLTERGDKFDHDSISIYSHWLNMMSYLFIAAPGDLDLIERGDKWVEKSSAEGALGARKSGSPGQQTSGTGYSQLFFLIQFKLLWVIPIQGFWDLCLV